MRNVFKTLTIIFLLIFMLPIALWASAQTATPSPDEIMQRVINSSFYKSIPNREDVSAVREKIIATYMALKRQFNKHPVYNNESDFERYRHNFAKRTYAEALRNIKACLAKYDFENAQKHLDNIIYVPLGPSVDELWYQFRNSVRAATVSAYRAYLDQMTSRLKTFAKALEKQSWPFSVATSKYPTTIGIRSVHFRRDHTDIDSITVERLLARHLKETNLNDTDSAWNIRLTPTLPHINWPSQPLLPGGPT